MKSFGWNFHFFGDLNDGEMGELLELMKSLLNFSLCPTVEDRREWILDKNGGFTCKSRVSTNREIWMLNWY